MTTPPREQRAYPRHPARMRVSAAQGDREFLLQPLDISRGGLGCRSERRLAPMTRLSVALEVGGGRGDREVRPLVLDSVVVRCEPQDRAEGVFLLGLRFVDERKPEQARLERFIEGLVGA